MQEQASHHASLTPHRTAAMLDMLDDEIPIASIMNSKGISKGTLKTDSEVNKLSIFASNMSNDAL